jgi:IS605 OrfB family transposase
MSKAQSTQVRTSQIIVRKHDVHFRDIAYVCQIARRIKNATHYLIRHEKMPNGKPLSHADADKWLKANNAQLYKKLPSALSQRTTQIVGHEWNSFWEAKKQFNKHPDTFKARPKPPRYANKATTAYIGRNGFRVIEGVVHFASDVIAPVKTQYRFSQDWNANVNDTILKEVRFVPKGNCYVIECIVDEAKLVCDGQCCALLDKSRHAGIDLGIDNLMAIATNQPDIHPALVKGKGLKSINAGYNKRVSKLRRLGKYDHIQAVTNKRHRQIKDALHKASRWVADYCLTHNIGQVVIGHNKGWKQDINIGKRNNQKFVAIPHTILINQLRYKLEARGVNVIFREESYTSKASALDNDHIPTKGSDIVPIFSGKRVKRGLYKASNGQRINADINAALNILRKESGELVACRGLVNRPTVF